MFARSDASASSVAISGVVWLVVFVEVAFLEEIACRGFLYDYIDARRGVFVAIVGSSVLFAALHSFNPHVSARAVAFLIPAGLMFAAARYATDSLWLGVGMHLGWNFSEGWLFGTPVSGLHVSPLFRFRSAGNELWSGGSFGPEAGLSVVVVVTVIAVVLLAVGLVRVRRDQRPGEVRLGILDGEA
jgi:membrane protease YdiL (CAAX protease family)